MGSWGCILSHHFLSCSLFCVQLCEKPSHRHDRDPVTTSQILWNHEAKWVFSYALSLSGIISKQQRNDYRPCTLKTGISFLWWRALPPHCCLLFMLGSPWAHMKGTVFITHVLPTDDSHVRELKNNCIYKVLATVGFLFFSWYPVLFSAIDVSSRASFPLVSLFFFPLRI